MNVYLLYCENLRVNQPLKVTFNEVAVAQSKVISRVTALIFMQFSLKFLPLNILA